MKKNIYIIRHGESVANIGEKTDSHDTIPLSEKGKEQAKKLVNEIKIAPNLIVISPYSRTKETAMPFIKKYKSVPVEVWDVHEFTYLNPKVYNNTSVDERMKAVFSYWNSLDIHYCDGGEAESFFNFIKRMESFIEKLKKRKEKNIVIFSHGLFIDSFKKYISIIDKVKDKNELAFNLMSSIKERISSGEKFPIDNASIHEIFLD